MDKFKLIINRIGSKAKRCCDAVYKKAPYIEPALIISASLLVVLVIIVSIKGALKVDVTTIEAKQAEVAFYNNNYEQAITEYEKLQDGEKWPFWQVKIAEIHSIKGDIQKSNELLKDATLKRNKILSDKGREKYDSKDREFINYVVFTYFMNEEYEQALSLGEQFIKDNGKDKTLMRTMYIIYMVDGQKDKAKEMIDNYEVDNESAYDLLLIAKMNMLSDNGNESEGYFRTALQKEPFNYNIMIKIAEYYAENSIDNEKARKYYNLAAAVKPNDSEIYYNLATLDLLDKNIESAIAYLNKAIEINENISKYHRTLGTIYLKQGEADKAIESIRIAYGIDTSDALTLNNAGCYYISIEGDIERGMDNIQGAYDGINNSMDKETKNTITKNYNKAKILYDEYNIGDEAELTVPEFTLLY